ncbi:MAG: acyl-CoA dehydrogenase family protein [Elusimicrobiota bacterium]|nr:acyl-CoA dehydrogenase family protein [Elusimicrobiota bacterium]
MENPALPGYPGVGVRNYWDDDADLRAAVEAAGLPPGAQSRLSGFGALVGGRLGELVERAHLPGNLPRLVDGAVGGQRAAVVAYCPEQIEARRLLAAAAFGQRELGLVERMALAVLANSAGEGGIGCPFAMTDGLERLLAARGTAEQKAALLAKVRSDDPDWALCGGQFVTERQGGSNVSANETVARPLPDGAWSLTGLKWFCSNPGELWVTTAKPEGSDTVALFLVRRRRDDGTLNGHKLLRLKQIGGTRGKATAEVEYQGARAEMIGKPREGLAILVSEVLSVSRRHVAAAALGFMGRALAEAEAFASWRVAYGRKVGEFPAAKARLERMRRERRAALGAFFLGMKAAAEDAPDAEVLVPMLKVEVSSLSSRFVRDAQLLVGGHGILDDFSPLNRLADDAVVNEIWEGTHPILAGHAAKALRRPRVLAAFLAHLRPDDAARLKARVEASRAWDEDEKNAGDEALVSEAYAALTATTRP